MINNVAVICLQSGDTSKGRWSSFFSKTFDYIIRFGGSSNCGHEIFRKGKSYVHHLLPSADYTNKNIKSFLTNNMFINPVELYEEICLFQKDYPHIGSTIIVDPDAFVITEEHVKFDKENNKHLMTTNKGVGPCAVSKVSRNGIRLYNLINDNAEIIQKLKELGVKFKPELEMREIFQKSSLLFEGHQGLNLDINSGFYPYVTTSDCTVSGIYSSGFHWIKLDRVFGTCKPYITKSGSGPLPTELNKDDAEKLRKAGREYGLTTGRDRRCGFLDLPLLNYAVKKSGTTHILMSKLDILQTQKSIRICNSYDRKIYSPNDINGVTPQYIDLPGWNDAKNIEQIKPFISYIENYCEIPIEYISAGVNDEDVIKIK